MDDIFTRSTKSAEQVPETHSKIVELIVGHVSLCPCYLDIGCRVYVTLLHLSSGIT